MLSSLKNAIKGENILNKHPILEPAVAKVLLLDKAHVYNTQDGRHSVIILDKTVVEKPVIDLLVVNTQNIARTVHPNIIRFSEKPVNSLFSLVAVTEKVVGSLQSCALSSFSEADVLRGCESVLNALQFIETSSKTEVVIDASSILVTEEGEWKFASLYLTPEKGTELDNLCYLMETAAPPKVCFVRNKQYCAALGKLLKELRFPQLGQKVNRFVNFLGACDTIGAALDSPLLQDASLQLWKTLDTFFVLSKEEQLRFLRTLSNSSKSSSDSFRLARRLASLYEVDKTLFPYVLLPFSVTLEKTFLTKMTEEETNSLLVSVVEIFNFSAKNLFLEKDLLLGGFSKLFSVLVRFFGYFKKVTVLLQCQFKVLARENLCFNAVSSEKLVFDCLRLTAKLLGSLRRSDKALFDKKKEALLSIVLLGRKEYAESLFSGFPVLYEELFFSENDRSAVVEAVVFSEKVLPAKYTLNEKKGLIKAISNFLIFFKNKISALKADVGTFMLQELFKVVVATNVDEEVFKSTYASFLEELRVYKNNKEALFERNKLKQEVAIDDFIKENVKKKSTIFDVVNSDFGF